MHPLEVEVAELVRKLVPNAENVRFSKTGADATSAAIRLSRAYTGRDRVVACGYHGWHDWYAGLLPRNAGVPKAAMDLVTSVPYGDLERTLAVLDERVACVILEPILFDEPRAGFLEELRAACTRRGVLLIFDEMWTGFRIALGGAQQHFGVTADLACFSKAVANGMPLSVLTGRREIMRLFDEDVFFFTTFGGEALSLAAAKATLEEMASRDVVAHLTRQGARLRDGYNAIARELELSFTRAKGLPARCILEFDAGGPDPLVAKSLVEQEMLRRGVLWSGFHNISFSHTDADVDRVLQAYRGALTVLAEAVHDGRLRERLRGEPIKPALRRTR
jgi:glutamate-1-semialdehyde aminotransferase